MNDEHRLRAVYPDILDDTADADLLRLVGRLDHDLATVYKTGTPPARLIAAIDRGAHQQARPMQPEPRQAPRFSFVYWLPRRLGMAGLAGLAILILASATYALLPVLEQAFGMHTGTGAIVSQGLGREVNLSRTVDGFTVTVRRVYADANQIVIGYTIDGPPGRAFNNIMAWGELDQTPDRQVARSPMLTDEHGNAFDGGLGGTQPGMQGGTAAALLTYTSVGLASDAVELRARLTIGELSAYERLDDGTFRDVTVDGPFVFDLTLPIERGRSANLHLTSHAGGATAILERVVTTPTGTRVSLRGVGPNAEVQLIVDGTTYTLHPPDGEALPIQWASDSQWDYLMGTSLQDQRGEWTLLVKPGPRMPADVEPSATFVAGGPWTFRFTVPE